MKPNEVEKEVDNLPSPQKRSRRGKSMKRKFFAVMAVIIGCLVITASAGLLTYYGKVTTTATVSQSVLLDGNDYTNPVTNTFDTVGGCCNCSDHYLESKACVEAPIVVETLYSPDGDGITMTYTVQTTDDNTNWGDNEVVAFPVTSGLTLNDLFAGAGLSYTYTILSGGTYDGASPVIAVIDLNDGRHIILFPGWGTRTGTHTLTFSETLAFDTGGNNYVDFSLQPNDFSSWLYGSGPTYGDFEFVKGDTSLLDGTEIVTRVAIQHQGANTGETDRVDSLTFDGTTYDFTITEGTPFTLYPGEVMHFRISYCFDIAILPGTYTIVSQFQPAP